MLLCPYDFPQCSILLHVQTTDLAMQICRRMQYFETPKGTFVMKQGDMTCRNTNTRYVYFLLDGEPEYYTLQQHVVYIDLHMQHSAV
jgi:hypothetical protein